MVKALTENKKIRRRKYHVLYKRNAHNKASRWHLNDTFKYALTLLNQSFKAHGRTVNKCRTVATSF